ncbi:MAG: nucleotide sugar dehydrogenase, partial [bacterium]|nr:nucleotide sugar dehydrogenase [bacterium]
VHLSAYFEVVGFDLKTDRIQELESGCDRTLEVSDKNLAGAKITYTSNPEALRTCRLIIVAVPTPIDANNIPDLGPLKGASATAGKYMSKGACVVFESTVYPGATEEVCVAILERKSGMKIGDDFTVGYSPERINPGDREHTLENIIKIVSGPDPDTTLFLSRVYGLVAQAGIPPLSS